MNPTRAHYRHSALQRQPTLPEYFQDGSRDGTDKEKPPYNDEEYASNIEFKWRSRDNRKGRHTLLVDPSDSSGKYITPKPTTTLHAAGQGILRMVTQYPYWDISYLVAIIFTLGSVVWVINAFFAWLPLVRPSTEFHNEFLYGGGITAFIGATIFEIGSVLLMFEAVNENRAGCFGWALEKVLEGDGRRGERLRIRADKDGCSHHHTNKHNLVGRPDGRFCFTHLSSGDRTGTSRCKHIRDSPISERKFEEFPRVHIVALKSSCICTLESCQTLLSNDVLLRVSHAFSLNAPNLSSRLPLHSTANKSHTVRASSHHSNIADSNASGDSPIEKPMHTNDDAKSWVWFPTTHDLFTHYFREIGFLASFAQFCGASKSSTHPSPTHPVVLTLTSHILDFGVHSSAGDQQ